MLPPAGGFLYLPVEITISSRQPEELFSLHLSLCGVDSVRPLNVHCQKSWGLGVLHDSLTYYSINHF